MDCLHCGRPLTFLKKWGDSRFCSDDHARAWKDAVQEAMLDRLMVSAEQFRRAVQKSKMAEIAITEPEPAEEVFEAPSAAGFRAAAIKAVEVTLDPLLHHVEAPANLNVSLPPGPPLVSPADRNASVSFPLSTDASLVVPVDIALAVATQSSS